MQGGAEVLGQEKDSLNPRIQTQADGNIDQAILPGDRHRGFGPLLRQGKETISLSPAQNDSNHLVRMAGGPRGHRLTLSHPPARTSLRCVELLPTWGHVKPNLFSWKR